MIGRAFDAQGLVERVGGLVQARLGTELDAASRTGDVKRRSEAEDKKIKMKLGGLLIYGCALGIFL